MKRLLRIPFACLIFTFNISCEKKDEPIINSDPCAKGKLIYQWCLPDTVLAIIEVLDTAIGGDFTTLGKTHRNTVLAHIELTLRKNGKDWKEVITSPDSLFYFTYQLKYPDFGYCEVGTPPKKHLRITSFLSSACPTSTQ